MKKNGFGSSFPTPLNIDNFIALAILTRSCWGGGTGEDGGESGVIGGGVGGSEMHKILYLIKLIALHNNTFASSSSPPLGGKIKGLFSGPLLPLFL